MMFWVVLQPDTWICGCKRNNNGKGRLSGIASFLLCLSLIVGVCIYAVYVQSRQVSQLGAEKAFVAPDEKPRAARHDKSSRFSIMRTGGRLFTDRKAHNNTMTLDALSIGTQYNLGLLEAQSRTWANHRSIRHYFAATENDDADPTCYKTLTKFDVRKIRRRCADDKPFATRGMEVMYERFALDYTWRGGGWMCAQQRFATSLWRLGRFYRNELEVDDDTLPDFLLLQDDDTYYNMVKIEKFLQDKDPSIPLAEAPCLIRHVSRRKLSFPWGGFGFILSRGAIKNLIRPVYCNRTQPADEFERNVCSRLQDDIIGERRYFRDGMSVSDLMGAQAQNNLFVNYNQTKDWAYCLHGDWAVGYYVNYYYVSNHIKNTTGTYGNMTEYRIEGTLGGTYNPRNKGNCLHGTPEKCNETAYTCHRQNKTSMTQLTKRLAAQNPGVFLNYG